MNDDRLSTARPFERCEKCRWPKQCAKVSQCYWPAQGRPPLHGVTMVKRLIGLDEASWEKARKLGNGNVSAGVRKALAMA